VGSEMCIRDRAFSGAKETLGSRASLPAGAAAAPSGPAVANFGPPSGLQR
jgi:hypothetical protein